MDVFTSHRHHNAHAVDNAENMQFHKYQPVNGHLPAPAPFVCASDTCHPTYKGPRKSETGYEKVRVSDPPQTTGLAVQFGTHRCGREAAPHTKQKRGNVEESPHHKNVGGVEGNPRKNFSCAVGCSTLSPMNVYSRVRLAKELPPSTATRYMRQQSAEERTE